MLKEYGYETSAFGKLHKTPATETTSMGPKDRWPNGYGCLGFYPRGSAWLPAALDEGLRRFYGAHGLSGWRLIKGLEQRSLKDNTLVFYIFGDNGSSAEGQQGSISELLALNGIANTIGQHIPMLWGLSPQGLASY